MEELNLDSVDIVSIEECGEEDVYDITNFEECWCDEGNFFAEGVLVHNCIPMYVERRDNPENNWKKDEHPEIIKILGDTQGVIVYQEQLTNLWQRIAGFTGPEAQEARKAVAKKWKDKLKPIRQKWIDGAKGELGESKAIYWWDEIMSPFGRYAFNLSHAVAYCLWAYRCLWLKAHYPEEWWASVMGLCDQKALERYMGAARTEGVLFGEIALGRMTKEPIANSGRNAVEGHKQVALGLTSLKNVGDSIADVFVDTEGNKTYTDIDDFIAKKGKSKTLLERLIKLGVFVGLHPNIKATWRWYLHEYCTGDLSEFEAANCEAFDDLDDQAAQEIKRIKAQIKSKSPNQSRFKFPIKIIREYHRRQLLANDGWTAETIAVERDRQIAEYKRLYPKRKILPKKLLNWMPNPNDTRERVMALYTNDYDLRQVLQFEKEFLGYYWHSPCDLYHCSGAHTVEHAKVNECLEGVIIDVFYGVTKLKSTMLKLKISDGKRECLVIVWEQDLRHQPRKLLATDVGVKLQVDYDPDRNSFTLQRGTLIEQLWSKKMWMELQATAE